MDIHRCGDCQKEFSSFEDFLIHKLLVEQYRLTVEPSRRVPGLRLPKFIKPVDQSSNPEKVNIDNDSSMGFTCKEESPGQTNNNAETNEHTASSEAEVPEVSVVETGPDSDGDDNASVCSHTESLRIDESAATKDNLTSPRPESQPDLEPKLNSQLYCRSCDRFYASKVVLRVHEETVHSTKRPFNCSVCCETFKTKGSLVRHNRTHTGERPFHCRDCGRSFHESGSLSRHIHRLHYQSSGTHTARAKRSTDMQVFITRLEPLQQSDKASKEITDDSGPKSPKAEIP